LTADATHCQVRFPAKRTPVRRQEAREIRNPQRSSKAIGAKPALEGGFSLIEALASLVVVGMIALMLVEGVTTGRRVWERMDVREARWEVLDAAQTTLRDRVEQIYPATLYDKAPPYIDFNGTSEQITFLANPPESERPGALRRYTLALDTATNLVLSSISDIPPPEQAPVTREVLLHGVRQLDVAYFGAAQPDYLRRWRPAWTDESSLPEVVRVRLTFEPGDARQWPDLIIRPRTTIDAACMLNPITHRCKGRI
jgi:general secretion pathway protein J